VASVAELNKVYWDANMWLGLINGESAKIRAIEFIYQSAKKGTYDIYTSTMSFVEVFRLRSEAQLTKPLPESNLDIIEKMFEQDFIKLISVDMEIARNARRLRRQLEFKGAPDSIHLASALRWNVDALHTYDGCDLLKFNNQLKSHNGQLLRICEPEEPQDGPLFDQTERIN
jgi:predicted nucleic acid-binding protein